MRDFEKISFEQFKKDVRDDKSLYEEFRLPCRSSSSTAGYDIYLLDDLVIEPQQIVKLPTGIKAKYMPDEVLLIVVRSGMGFKHNIRLCNQVGVIDADYYNNKDNEGHIWVKIQNEGDKTVTISKGQAVVQGIFMKYLTTDTDNNLNIERTSDKSNK